MIHDLRHMQRVLGGTISGRQLLAPGPGHSASDRSLSIRLSAQAPDGFLAFSHAGDDWRACRDHILARLGETPSLPLREQPRPSPVAAPERQNVSVSVQARWREAVDPRGTIIEEYLLGRCLALPDEIAGEALRFHSTCPWQEEDGKLIRVTAMVAPFRDIHSNEIVGLHRTRLATDLAASGKHLGRKMTGRVKDAAVMLDPPEDVTYGLHIGEGIETMLSARQLQPSFRPAWALGSAGAVAAFPVLASIDCLSICAEFDDAGANAKAIEQVGNRWCDAGREVRIVDPRVGGDLNDAIRNTAA